MWQVLTGTIEHGETAVHTVHRELEEELGIVALKMWVLPFIASFYSASSDSMISVPVFGCTIPGEVEILLSAEHCQFGWHDAASANDALVIPAQKQGVELFDTILNSRIDDDMWNRVYQLQ
jgi:8-oxo-dGTP pyrophosphatase MutT (NUDIX family)